MLSNLSSIPPCPGNIEPLSFTFNSLLNFDSIKSPKVPNTLIIIAVNSQFCVVKESFMNVETNDADMQEKNRPPKNPSTVFLGEIE